MKKIAFAAVLAVFAAALSHGPLFAEDAVGSTVLVKMQEVLEKQDRILQELDQIKEELRVVKVRTTLNG
jgi:hypothetical protein